MPYTSQNSPMPLVKGFVGAAKSHYVFNTRVILQVEQTIKPLSLSACLSTYVCDLIDVFRITLIHNSITDTEIEHCVLMVRRGLYIGGKHTFSQKQFRSYPRTCVCSRSVIFIIVCVLTLSTRHTSRRLSKMSIFWNLMTIFGVTMEIAIK